MGAQWDQRIGAMSQNPQKDATRPSKTLRWSVAVALLLPCLGVNGEEDDGVKGARGPPSQGQGQGRTGTGQPPAGRKSQCLRGFRAGIRDGLMMDCGGGEGNFSLQCWSPSRHRTFRRVVVPHEVARFGAKRTRRPEPDSSCRALEEWRRPHGGMTDLHSGGNNRWLMDGWAGDQADIAEVPLTAAAWVRRGRRGQRWIGGRHRVHLDKGAVLSLTTTLETC